jgi:hypothetical protein
MRRCVVASLRNSRGSTQKRSGISSHFFSRVVSRDSFPSANDAGGSLNAIASPSNSTARALQFTVLPLRGTDAVKKSTAPAMTSADVFSNAAEVFSNDTAEALHAADFLSKSADGASKHSEAVNYTMFMTDLCCGRASVKGGMFVFSLDSAFDTNAATPNSTQSHERRILPCL